MHHIAIMNKKWKLIEKILLGEKIIESRWYLTRRDPWLKIKQGDTIFLKNSGEPVSAKAEVEKVLYFGPTPSLIDNIEKFDANNILKKYGKEICILDIQEALNQVKTKKYCILAFMKNPEKITPFNIDKTGFGISSAWLCTDNIEKLKILS